MNWSREAAEGRPPRCPIFPQSPHFASEWLQGLTGGLVESSATAVMGRFVGWEYFLRNLKTRVLRTFEKVHT